MNTDALPHYPASYDLPNVVAVAATHDRDGRVAYSNYGARSVDLGAPGQSIYSTVPVTPWEPSGLGTNSGTSMAAPHVSGAAALVLSRFPDLNYRQVKQRLLYGSDPVKSLAGVTVTGGRLNAFTALEEDAVSPDPAPGLEVVATETRRVTLAWTATGDDGSVAAHACTTCGTPPPPSTTRASTRRLRWPARPSRASRARWRRSR